MSRLPVAGALLATVMVVGCSESKVTVRTVSNSTGAPMSGIRVQVDDQAWVATDAAGEAQFTVSSGTFTVRAHQTYDEHTCNCTIDNATILLDQTGSEVVVTVAGQTSKTNEYEPNWYEAQVSGTVTGATGAASAVTRVQQSFEDGGLRYVDLAAGSSAFATTAALQGATSGTVTLRAFEADRAGNAAVNHLYAAGAVQVAVTAGASVTGVSIPLSPVSEGSAAGTASIDPQLAGGFIRAFWRLRVASYGGVPIRGASASIDPGAFSVTAPSVPAADTWVSVSASPSSVSGSPYGHHSRRVTVPSSGLTFKVPAAPVFTAPAAGASFDSSTPFRWTSTESGGTYYFGLSCPSTTGFMTISVTTTASEVTVPNVDGVLPPSGTECTWYLSWCAATDPTVEERCSNTAYDRTVIVR